MKRKPLTNAGAVVTLPIHTANDIHVIYLNACSKMYLDQAKRDGVIKYLTIVTPNDTYKPSCVAVLSDGTHKALVRFLLPSVSSFEHVNGDRLDFTLTNLLVRFKSVKRYPTPSTHVNRTCAASVDRSGHNTATSEGDCLSVTAFETRQAVSKGKSFKIDPVDWGILETLQKEGDIGPIHIRKDGNGKESVLCRDFTREGGGNWIPVKGLLKPEIKRMYFKDGDPLNLRGSNTTGRRKEAFK